MPYEKTIYVRRGESVNRWYLMAIAYVDDFRGMGVLQIPHAARVAEYKKFFTKKGKPRKPSDELALEDDGHKRLALGNAPESPEPDHVHDDDELLRVLDGEDEIIMRAGLDDDHEAGEGEEGVLVPPEDDKGDGDPPDEGGDPGPVLPREPPHDGDFSFVDALGHVFAVTYRPSTPTQKARWQCRCLVHPATKTRTGQTFCTATVQIDEEDREDSMNYLWYWCEIVAGAHMHINIYTDYCVHVYDSSVCDICM